MRRPITAITGATGFVGAGLVRHMRDQGWPVVALARGSEPRFAATEGQMDITRADHMTALVGLGFRADVIVHLAGMVDVALVPDPEHPESACRPGQASLAPLYAANVLGVANVVDLARACGARRIVFASSQTVYGYGEGGYADENTPLRPLEHYAASKACAEQVLELASKQGLSVIVLRFPGIYAPSRPAGAVQAMCRSALERRHIVLRADCAVPFDVLALADLLPAIVGAIKFEGTHYEVFNLATGQPCSYELLADRIATLVPGTRVEKANRRQPVFRMSATRAERLLNWRAMTAEHRLVDMLEAQKK